MVNYATTSGMVREFSDINVVSIKDGIAEVVQDLVSMDTKGNYPEKRVATIPVLPGETRESLWKRLNDFSDTVINASGQVVKVKMAV
jgi:hypothetical protein